MKVFFLLSFIFLLNLPSAAASGLLDSTTPIGEDNPPEEAAKAAKEEERTVSKEIVREDPLFFVDEDGERKYIDINGNIVLDSSINPFYPGKLSNPREGLFIYENPEGKTGLVDYSFNVVMEPRYFRIDPFSEGLAAFTYHRNGKYGYINKKGEVVIEPQFDKAYPFSFGMTRVEWKGETQKEDRAGYINKEGKILYEFLSDGLFYTDAYDGLATVGSDRDKKTAFINEKGEVVFEFNTSPYTRFQEGLAIIYVENEESYDIKKGFIDKKGNIVIPPIYQIAKPFGNGLAPVQEFSEKYYYYINKSGEKVLEGNFIEAGSFSEGFAKVWVMNPGEDYMQNIIINTQGEVVFIRPDHIDELGTFSDGLIETSIHIEIPNVGRDTKYGYLNTQGVEVWKPTK